MLPGTYTVKLTVDGKTLTTKAEVRLDPRVSVSEADLKEQARLALTLRDDISRLARSVESLRAVKKQLDLQIDLLKDQKEAETLVKSARALIRKLDEVEGRLHNPRAEVAYDILAQRGGAQLYSQLALLYDFVMDGDGAPTQGMREMHAEHARSLQARESELKALLSGELGRYNEAAKKLALPTVHVPAFEKPLR